MKVLKVQDCEVLLDDYDWLRLCRIKWKIRTPKDGAKYICCNKWVTLQDGCRAKKTIYLHRAISCPPYGLDLPPDIEVHHKNSNPLDNQQCNLERLNRVAHGKMTRNNHQ